MYCFIHDVAHDPGTIACSVTGHDLVDQDPRRSISTRAGSLARVELIMAPAHVLAAHGRAGAAQTNRRGRRIKDPFPV